MNQTASHLPATSATHVAGIVDDQIPQPSTRKYRPLSEYDPILGPTLAVRADWPVRDAALAVACRGLDASVKIPPAAIRLWLRSRGGDRFESITSLSRSFQLRVVSRARAKVSSASSLPARRREAWHVASRLVGILITEAPTHVAGTGKRVIFTLDGRRVPAPRLVDARHALAIVGLALIDSCLDEGRDTVLVSGSWLAVRMGVGERKARAALHTCVDLGWLRLVSKRAGSSGRYDLGTHKAKWPTPAARAAARDYPFTLDALVERTPSADALAEVVTAAAHHAVSHGLHTKAWLVGLAMQTGISPTRLGLARGVTTAKQAWLSALTAAFAERPESTLLEALDDHATTTGADVRARAAEAARRAAADQRQADIEQHRKHKAVLHQRLLPHLREQLPLPPVGDTSAQVAWVEVMTAEVAGAVPDDIRSALATALTRDMKTAGYRDEVATRVPRHIAGLPALAEITTSTKDAA